MDRQQTVEVMKQKLDKWNADIDALESKANKVSAEKRDEFRASVAELKEKQAKAAAEVERLKSAAGDSFDDISRGLNQAWDALAASFKDARQRYN